MADKKFRLRGILKGVAMSDGESGKGKWQRASLTVEKGDKSLKASTFDVEDIKVANAANGKEVEVVFTKSSDGKYRNIVKGGIKVVGQGETPVTEEEAIEDDDAIEEIGPEKKKKNEEQAALEVMTEKEGKKMDPGVQTGGTEMTKDDYWESKFRLDKQKLEFDKLKHMQIAREASWDRAVEYIGHMLKAVELGAITKTEFNKEDLNFEEIRKIAHKIELDILNNEVHKK